MKTSFRFSIAAAVFAAIVIAGLALGAVTAGAQSLPWNGPCTTATIYNTTQCPVQLTLWTNPVGTVPPVVVPPCGAVTIATPPPGLLIRGVISQAGVMVAMIRPSLVPPPHTCPPIPPSPLVPGEGWVRGVTTAPSGCCVDVYFYRNADPANPCTIWIFPGTPPCTP